MSAVRLIVTVAIIVIAAFLYAAVSSAVLVSDLLNPVGSDSGSL